LEKLFSRRSGGKASREWLIAEAVTAHGYSQMEMASFLPLNYPTISRILAANKAQILKTVCPCAGLDQKRFAFPFLLLLPIYILPDFKFPWSLSHKLLCLTNYVGSFLFSQYCAIRFPSPNNTLVHPTSLEGRVIDKRNFHYISLVSGRPVSQTVVSDKIV
jgi:hypothetical protein